MYNGRNRSESCVPNSEFMSSHPRFDPYYEWLGIEPHEQPADFYRLLGLARFETDARRIEQVADERMALVRSLQMGPRGAYTQKLLNELAAARVCLLKPRSKANYDAELARRLADLQTQQRVMATTEPLAPPVFSMHPPADHLPKIRLARRRPIALALAALLAVLFQGCAGYRSYKEEPTSESTCPSIADAAKGTSAWPGRDQDHGKW
jgi:hypothetical protein